MACAQRQQELLGKFVEDEVAFSKYARERGIELMSQFDKFSRNYAEGTAAESFFTWGDAMEFMSKIAPHYVGYRNGGPGGGSYLVGIGVR